MGRLTFAITVVCIAGFAVGSQAKAGTEKTVVFVSGTDADGGSTASETTDHLMRAYPHITVTLDRDKADYAVVRDYTGAGPGRKPQKITVFNRQHELVFTDATRSVGGAEKDIFKAIKATGRKDN
jgi:hypothetical protein